MRRVLLLWLVLGWLLGCREAPPAQVVAATLPLRVSAPTTVQAGAGMRVEVSAENAPDMLLTLTLVGSYGTWFTSGAFENGRASIYVPTTATQQSGHVRIMVRGDGYMGSTTTQILSGPVVGPLTPLVGARSIVADGTSWAMTVVVPFDQFANPLTDGTPFTVRVRHPDQVTDVLNIETKSLVAWERIYSHTRAGRSTIALESDGIFGSSADLLEVAGWPETLSVSAEFDHLEADGRQLVTLQTDVIADRFGNPMPDGTQVLFVVEGVEGKRTLPALTLDGSAETTLQAPDQPQTVSITVTVYDRVSQPFSLRFTQSVTEFAASAAQMEDGSVEVTAGPVLGALKQFVPDGTRATITLGDSVVEARVVDGYVRSSVQGVGEAELVTVQIGAVQVSAEIEERP